MTDNEQCEQQRDTAWAELREIREAIGADPEESTADEVRALMAERIPDGSALLPCDIQLPPAATIRAGCKVSTLVHALEVRGMPKLNHERLQEAERWARASEGRAAIYAQKADDAERQNGVLREALQPFADFASKAFAPCPVEPGFLAKTEEESVVFRPSPEVPPIKAKHLRNAWRAVYLKKVEHSALTEACNASLGKMKLRLQRAEHLIESLLDNDPDDTAADGVTVLMAWRKEAAAFLGRELPNESGGGERCPECGDSFGVDDVTRWASWLVHAEGAAGVPSPSERVMRIAHAIVDADTNEDTPRATTGERRHYCGDCGYEVPPGKFQCPECFGPTVADPGPAGEKYDDTIGYEDVVDWADEITDAPRDPDDIPDRERKLAQAIMAHVHTKDMPDPAPADRPPSEALEAFERITDPEPPYGPGSRYRFGDDCQKVRRALSQPVPAVPERIRQLPDMWERSAPLTEMPGREVYEIVAADLRNALADSAQRAPDNLRNWLDELRGQGLMVAVHNDYRQNGEHYTFWLFVGPSGMSYKGEGHSDAQALQQVRRQVAAAPTPAEGDAYHGA